MCATCGCGETTTHALDHVHEHVHTHDHDHEHAHHHHHDHDHDHDHEHHYQPTRKVALELELELLAKNDARAAANRAWLAERAIVAFNLMSSPGSGKTTLLERTLRDLGARRAVAVAVIEGDQETARDAERIRAAGGRALQINTGAGCHLDADMVARALAELQPAARAPRRRRRRRRRAARDRSC
jgi:hydrogenase nickel incorporation protein HypB